MRRSLLIVAVLLVVACASSPPAHVQVIGTPQDLVPLSGDWVGSYDNAGSGRTGTIRFQLTDDPNGAHGDVVFIPVRDITYRGDDRHPMASSSGAVVLTIEFVRIASGEISGKIAPYSDPTNPDATLETQFTGHFDGMWIEGTFVTYSSHGVAPQRGTWRAHRRIE